ncbi:MAG: DUF1328 domain-containing protein [Lacipirellulaceae bacterium]
MASRGWHAACSEMTCSDESRGRLTAATGSYPHSATRPTTQGSKVMLGWALTFMVVALIAGVLGFTGIAGASAGIAKILFFVFLVLFLVSLVIPRLRGGV